MGHATPADLTEIRVCGVDIEPKLRCFPPADLDIHIQQVFGGWGRLRPLFGQVGKNNNGNLIHV